MILIVHNIITLENKSRLQSRRKNAIIRINISIYNGL